MSVPTYTASLSKSFVNTVHFQGARFIFHPRVFMYVLHITCGMLLLVMTPSTITSQFSVESRTLALPYCKFKFQGPVPHNTLKNNLRI
jgi:hypothetical protein